MPQRINTKAERFPVSLASTPPQGQTVTLSPPQRLKKPSETLPKPIEVKLSRSQKKITAQVQQTGQP